MSSSRKRVLEAYRALVASAISDEVPPDEASDPGSRQFGSYLLEAEIGRGGFGVVYRARQAGIERPVALKKMRDAELATDSEIRRFLAGAAAASALDHPNIVPILHADVFEGRPFFTMRLIEGQSLCERLASGLPTRQQALEWAIKVARAVAHAHERGIVHLDIKPANILIDHENEPYVTDFGLARRLDTTESMSSSSNGRGPGTKYYMPSEQASGATRDITVRSDVYGLGALLHELLTGRAPYEGMTEAEWLVALASPNPTPSPRALVPDLEDDLESICNRALAKQASERYPSVAELALDLECVLRGDAPPGVRVPSRFEVAWAWARRQSLLHFAVAELALLLLFFALTAGFVSQRQREELLQSALEMNGYAARAAATSLLYRLHQYADRLETVARSATAQQLALAPHWVNPSLTLAPLAEGFGSMAIEARSGAPQARWPVVSDAYFARSHAFRDFFRGAARFAARGERRAYVARSYRSDADEVFKFALAAPIFRDDEWVGAVLASIVTDSTLGLSPREPRFGRGPITVLLGPRDVASPELAERRSEPPDFVFLLHPNLERGAQQALDAADTLALNRRFGSSVDPDAQFTPSSVDPLLLRGYRDPHRGGRWLAAFAPVGHTGYIALVQSLEEAALEPTERLRQRLSYAFLAASALLAGVFGVFARWKRGSRSRR